MQHIEVLETMKNQTIKNYVLEGLSSSLVGGGVNGLVRMFDSSRNQRRHITPHSHRFDFTCLVVAGFVINEIWNKDELGDPFGVALATYKGEMGKSSFGTNRIKIGNFSKTCKTYRTGDWYSMTYDEIHSIEFSKNSKVLFFEGPKRTNTTKVLLPFVDGVLVDTTSVESWMYSKSA